MDKLEEKWPLYFLASMVVLMLVLSLTPFMQVRKGGLPCKILESEKTCRVRLVETVDSLQQVYWTGSKETRKQIAETVKESFKDTPPEILPASINVFLAAIRTE